MPFKSQAQMRYMFAKHPNIAKEWADKYGVPKNMPHRKHMKVEVTHKNKVKTLRKG